MWKSKTAHDRLNDVLEPLNDVTKSRMCSAVEDLMKERLESETFNLSCSSAVPTSTVATDVNMNSDDASTSTITTSNLTSSRTNNVQTQNVTNEDLNEKNDLIDHLDLKKKHCADRLCLILDIHDECLCLIEADRQNLTEGSKTFIRQSMTPTLMCCKEC